MPHLKPYRRTIIEIRLTFPNIRKNCFMYLVGSTTACLVSLDTGDNRLHAVNLGDSGYMVVRDGRILARSQEQQHYFNTPFQLTLVPPAYRGRVLSDR